MRKPTAHEASFIITIIVFFFFFCFLCILERERLKSKRKGEKKFFAMLLFLLFTRVRLEAELA